jgi:hypothetical protein
MTVKCILKNAMENKDGEGIFRHKMAHFIGQSVAHVNVAKN